ncbi:hypothetical protein GA0074695_3676 [Micromonospora viridifaciens]|uniref:Uncharacterized protein n=1 Tax=Micromonospora viridifaciens TaxID=1881 RepID=A0A1C4XWZ1_MICVI|nr:hypothetical protein [Micromonospora viridifaciens]SCF12965.1 hypothetical protein GA0074695_3676 [Micromonospora viridifaciens]
MKQHFTRWLPAIAQTSHRTTELVNRWLPTIARSVNKTPQRKAALSIAGVAVLGGLAFGPSAFAAPVTTSPHAGAVAAIDVATGKQVVDVKSDLTTGAGKVPGKANPPSRDKLVPHGVEGAQSRIPLDDAQIANAKAIVKAAKETGVGERGAVIGVATSLQESKLYNLGHLGAYNDHDSEGLFQQRPSSGWGTSEQITDPDYASKAFFNALKNVGDWQDLPLTTAAQTVQVSAYPYAYAQWEDQAADVVQQVW